MKKSNIVKTLLVLLLSLSMVACGNSKSNNSGQSPSATDNSTSPSSPSASNANTSTDNHPLEFSYMLNNKYYAWLQDLNWYPPFAKAANANIKLVDGGEAGKYDTNVDLRISSGDFPDSGITDLGRANIYGSQGAFVDLKPLIDQYAPNLKKYLDDRPDLKALIDNDGKIYGIPQEVPRGTHVLFYREDLAKAAGVSAPQTIDQFTDFLKALKQKNANVPNFYPYTGRGSLIRDLAPAFDAAATVKDGKIEGYLSVGEDGFNVYAPGFKQMIEWFRNAYNDGLIDPEWVNGTQTEDSWVSKMLLGQGALSSDSYTRPSSFMISHDAKKFPDYQMKVIPPLQNIDTGKPSVYPDDPSYRTDRVFVINKKAKNPEDIMKFLNFAYSQEGADIMHWGVEGESYKVVDGKKQYTVDYKKESSKNLGEKAWTFYQSRLTFPSPVDSEADGQFQDDYTKTWLADYIQNYSQPKPVLKYTDDEAKEVSKIQAQLTQYLEASTIKFITGKTPMSEWPAFEQKVKDLGYDRMVEIDQQALDRIKNGG